MKKLLCLFSIFMVVFFFSCKKDNGSPDTKPSASDTLTTTEHVSQDDNNLDAITLDLEGDVESFLTQTKSILTPCNATLDSIKTYGDSTMYFITYNGLSCNGKFNKFGKVEIKRKTIDHWYNAGCGVTVKEINMTITRTVNNKTVIVNSFKTHRNVSGGLIPQLNGTNHITHKTTGIINVLFDNTTTKIWNISKIRTFTGAFPDSMDMTLTGDGTLGTRNHMLSWGTNRDSEEFFVTGMEPIVFKEKCSWDPCSGKKKIEIPSDNKGATITFGYNNQNQPIGPNDCPTKYKLEWWKGNNTGIVYLYLH